MTARTPLRSLTLAGLSAALAVNPLLTSVTGPQTASSTTRKTTRAKSPTSVKPTVPATVKVKVSAPNILFVLADDMGVDASPCYRAFGITKPKMPNVEQLCHDGVVFDNMTASPVCSPSRAAALTGKYGFRTNVGNVDDELSADETSIHDVVAAAPVPYANALIGKWHLGGAQPDPAQPQRLGVEYFDGFLRAQVQDYSNWPRVTQGQASTSTVYTTTAFTDSAIAWTSKQTKPWFLWLAYNAPHTPFHLPPAALVSDPTLSGAADDVAQNPQKYYFAALEALDKELGRLLASMPASTRENTVVMFMGDNGTPSRVAQEPFTIDNSKGTVSEGGVHVPLIVAGAGVTPRATRNASLLNGVDVFPTIAELAHGKVTSPIDGVSFASTLHTEGASSARTFAYSELFTGTVRAPAATPTRSTLPGGRPRPGGGNGSGGVALPGGGASTAGVNVWAVRDERYKLVHDVATGDEQVFDLQADPSESRGAAPTGAMEAVASRLRNIVAKLRSQ